MEGGYKSIDTLVSAPTYSGGSFHPPADNAFDLGSTALSWRNLYVDNVVYATSVLGNWSPSADDTYDLGTLLLQWKDIYIDGVAYLDTAQIEVKGLVLDDILFALGTDSDIVALNRSTVLNANTALTGVLIGTPVASAIAANSLMISNVTASGDIALYYNLAGNSQMALWIDASAQTIYAYDDINIGANSVVFAGDCILYTAGNNICVKDTTKATFRSFVGNFALAGSFAPIGSLLDINSGEVDNRILLGKSQDTGVGLVETWRMVGAADPYFQIGRDDTGVGLSSVTDGLVLQMGGLTGNEAAGQGFGMSWKIGNASSEVEERGSIDLVLVTATNASEASRFDFNVMTAGAMGLVFSVPAAGINLASGKVLQVNAVQVVGARVVDARADDVVDATYGAEEAGVIDALRDAMITHGLIAAA